ncbi:MAG TPA: NfeD family protein, partial [Nocardioides sp.]|nr:NfeD family protein [Nocardioides sp.]
MDWLSEHAWAAWLGIAAVLGMAELVSLDLVLAMLAVGALAGMVTAAIGAGVAVQVVVAGVA